MQINERALSPAHVRVASSDELERHLPAFVDLLSDAVNAGASLGFVAPLSHDDARSYWLSIRADLQAGSRLLLIALVGDRIIGSGQLVFPPWPIARHRAEIQKLIVAGALWGQGVGKVLMAALHGTARRRGRSLLLLTTRRGFAPERFYKRLGYHEAGVLPGGSMGPAGERYDIVTLYQEIAAAAAPAAAVAA